MLAGASGVMRDDEAVAGKRVRQRARVAILVVIHEVLEIAAAVDIVVATSAARQRSLVAEHRGEAPLVVEDAYRPPLRFPLALVAAAVRDVIGSADPVESAHVARADKAEVQRAALGRVAAADDGVHMRIAPVDWPRVR